MCSALYKNSSVPQYELERDRFDRFSGDRAHSANETKVQKAESGICCLRADIIIIFISV